MPKSAPYWIGILLLFLTSNLDGQTVTFCSDYNANGKPFEASDEWELEEGKNHLVLYLFLQNSKIISANYLNILIEKWDGRTYQPFDIGGLRPGPLKTWAAFKYTFRENGEFRVSFLNEKRERIAQGELMVIFPWLETEKGYYREAEMVFCESSSKGVPNGIISEGLNWEEGKEITLLLNLGKPLETERIRIDVWRILDKATNEKEFSSTLKFKVDPDWEHCKVRWEVGAPGLYEFSVYTWEERFIQSVQLEIRSPIPPE